MLIELSVQIDKAAPDKIVNERYINEAFRDIGAEGATKRRVQAQTKRILRRKSLSCN